MKKYSTYLIIVGLIGIILLAAFPVRNYYLFLKEPVAPLTDAIPEQTAVIIKTGSLQNLIKVIRSSALGKMPDDSTSGSPYQNLVSFFEKYSEKSDYFSSLAEQNEIMICLVPDKDSQPQFLFLAAIGKTSPGDIRDEIEKIMPAGTQIEKINHKPADLYKIRINEREYWFFISKGVLAFSLNREIIEQSCLTTSLKTNLTTDRSFGKLSKTSGKRVDGILIINNRKLANLVFRLEEEKITDLRTSLFNGWTALDLHIEEDRVIMDGFTSGRNDTTLLSGQEAVEAEHFKLFPAETAFALSLSISNQEKYTTGFFKKDTMQLSGYDSANNVSSKEIFRRKEHLRSWIGNTISLVAMPRYFAGEDSARMTLIGLKNADSAKLALKPFMQAYRGDIRIFTAVNLPESMWGRLFSAERKQYCIISDQFLIISPSWKLLDSYLQQKSENRLLGNTRHFQEAAGLMMEKSNLNIWLLPDICRNYFNNQTNDKGNKAPEKWLNLPASTELIYIQVSAGEPLMYTHAIALLKQKTTHNIPPDPVQIQKADSLKNDKKQASAPPQAENSDKSATSNGDISGVRLLSGKKAGDNLLLTNRKNTIEAWSGKGKLLWAFTCKSEPSGEVYEIEKGGEKGKQYLIGSGEYLHIVGENGKEVKGSPVKLPAGINGSIAVIDYDRNRDYRVLYPGKDKLIHNLTLKGEALTTWQKPELSNNLAGPVQFFRTAGKDYLLYADSKGHLSVIDRRGRQRIGVAEEFRISSGSAVFENRTNSKGLFLMVSKKGTLSYLDGNGRISESDFGDYGKDPWFDYLDFNGDGESDFIFCGNGQVVVHSKMKKVIASSSIKKADFSKPFIYTSKKVSWLAVRDRKSNKVLVFNNKNQALGRELLLSETDPVILPAEGSGKPVMVTLLNKKLVFTTLE